MIKPTKILRIISVIIGWMFVGMGGSIVVGMFFDVYVLPPKMGILLTLIGSVFFILGEKKSNITLIDSILFLGVISVLVIY